MKATYDRGPQIWENVIEGDEKEEKRSRNLYRRGKSIDISMAPNKCRLHQQPVFQEDIPRESDMPYPSQTSRESEKLLKQRE